MSSYLTHDFAFVYILYTTRIMYPFIQLEISFDQKQDLSTKSKAFLQSIEHNRFSCHDANTSLSAHVK